MEAVVSRSQSPAVLQLLAHDLRWRLVESLSRSDRTVKELVHSLDRPANLVSYHLKRLRGSNIVRERRSSADARDVYYSLDVQRLQELYTEAGRAIHPALNTTPEAYATDAPGRPKRAPVRILFLCTRNSARSQMAEGIARALGGDRVEVFSAGNEPSDVRPEAIEALREIGIDISGQTSKHLDTFRNQRFDYVITVCDRARESCPVFPGNPEQIHWSFMDPAAVEDERERQRAFRNTALQLRTRIDLFLTAMQRDRGR